LNAFVKRCEDRLVLLPHINQETQCGLYATSVVTHMTALGLGRVKTWART
jgi:hypothetical protein